MKDSIGSHGRPRCAILARFKRGRAWWVRLEYRNRNAGVMGTGADGPLSLAALNGAERLVSDRAKVAGLPPAAGAGQALI